MFEGKKVLVTGSNGLIGKELVRQLMAREASVYEFDISKNDLLDVTDLEMCRQVIEDYRPEYIFHLFGIKGSPKRTNEKPVDFMAPMLQGDTNMILAAQEYGVKRFLYTSSIAVLHPESDVYPSWAKQTSEKVIEAKH